MLASCTIEEVEVHTGAHIQEGREEIDSYKPPDDKGDEAWDSAFNGERSGQGMQYSEDLNMVEATGETGHGRLIMGARDLCKHG